MMIPIAVSIINESGVPIVMIPDEREMSILSGVISAVLDISKRVSGEEIEFVKTKNRIIFLKHIGGRGYLLLAFKNIKDPKEVGWIVVLFINELERYLETAYSFVDDVLISAIKQIYNQLTEEVQLIFLSFMRIKRYYNTLRKVIGVEADALLMKCSQGLIVVRDDKIIIDSRKIRDENLDISIVRKTVIECEKSFNKCIKRFV